MRARFSHKWMAAFIAVGLMLILVLLILRTVGVDTAALLV